MDGNFRQELDAAVGVSEFVIALNLDIRGFTDWSLSVDSAQTALYVKKIYAKLIDCYFGGASMVKPTGDGLFVVKSFAEKDLQETVVTAVENSIEIVDSFGSLCDDEPMINFDVPKAVGIGLSRGSACRLASGDDTLDYSGRVLNLASRLMDLARPRGLVFDKGLGIELIPEDLIKDFSQHDVYIRGASPIDPITIFCSPDGIEIPEGNLHPIGETRWEEVSTTQTQKELAAGAPNWRFDFDPQPIDAHEVKCEVNHASITPGKRKSKGKVTYIQFPVTMHTQAGKKHAKVNIHKLAKETADKGVGPTWPVTITVFYRSM